jgi:hypothetical protein
MDHCHPVPHGTGQRARRLRCGHPSIGQSCIVLRRPSSHQVNLSDASARAELKITAHRVGAAIIGKTSRHELRSCPCERKSRQCIVQHSHFAVPWCYRFQLPETNARFPAVLCNELNSGFSFCIAWTAARETSRRDFSKSTIIGSPKPNFATYVNGHPLLLRFPR